MTTSSTTRPESLQQQWQCWAQQQAEAQAMPPLPQPTARPTWPWWVGSVALAASVAWLLSLPLLPQLNSQEAIPAQLAATEQSPMLLADAHQLDAIDQRIQLAYLHQADAQILQQLWQQRAQLVAQVQLNREWIQ